MTESRPDPDALLTRAQAEEPQPRHGRLKVFFGMCAGVGKTYAMLQEARERRQSGTDVLAGYIETHKRTETDALKVGLEELPPLWVDYRGVRLRELDLDAVLARRPGLVLVDELAHTNAESLRHAKRYQDVLEILDAGIDVYTTVNVQHIESLNDVVAQITGVSVNETVPDSMIERADEIELVDIPPDDLLERLREGKVYVADQVQRAVQQFFRRENLVALRELALRETAARVGEQVRVERAGRGETRPWATSERILVCVGPSPLSARVIRIARRMAAAVQAEWLAVSIETPGQSEIATAQVRRNLKLAERLGAEPTVLSGDRVVDEILAYAVRHNVTKIVVGKPTLPRWREWLRGSIVDELIRRSGEIDVHVVKGEPEDVVAARASTDRRQVDWKAYAAATGVIAVCTILAAIAGPYVPTVNLTMIFLAGVVFVATRYTVGPSVLGSVLAAFLFNFLFTEPYYTFVIHDPTLFITFIALLVTALVVSGLAQRVRRQAQGMRTRYHRTFALYFMSRQLAAAASADSLARVAAKHVADVFQGDTVILIPDSLGHLAAVAQSGEFAAELTNERTAAQWVFEHRQWAGWSTETLPASQAIYLPLIASGKPLGVLAMRPRRPESPLEPDQRHMLETFATQLAIAMERAAFASEAEVARREAETEHVRSSLLSCVSHDLRTPLAAIAGAASTLVDDPAQLTGTARRELAQSIAEEAGRLNQLVGKLLDMTRLEAAGFRLQKDWYPLDELVGAALTRLSSALHPRPVTTDIPGDLPLLQVDGPLIEEVLGNLLENAARYTPSDSTVTVRASSATNGILVEVMDEGPGLQPGTEKDIFRRFVRHRPSGDRSGSGLGLAICEAVVRLHGGQMGAENRLGGGARFWFTLPVTPETPPGFSGASDSAAADQTSPTSTLETMM
ncbi:MAG: sensor histidine kinase KdpD [Phycisphaerales bacterium]|nr:sensor histidine kinase KdpD [Phycisphaerales bacterium]